MTNQSQKEFVLKTLKEKGFITRNECLQRYISRLGAHICMLIKEGHDIKGEYIKTEYGTDYIYRLAKKQTNLF